MLLLSGAKFFAKFKSKLLHLSDWGIHNFVLNHQHIFPPRFWYAWFQNYICSWNYRLVLLLCFVFPASGWLVLFSSWDSCTQGHPHVHTHTTRTSRPTLPPCFPPVGVLQHFISSFFTFVSFYLVSFWNSLNYYRVFWITNSWSSQFKCI